MNVDLSSTTHLESPEWGVFRQDRPATVGYLVSLTRERSAAETIARDIVREGRGGVAARVVHLGASDGGSRRRSAVQDRPECCSMYFGG
jgi:hypothetical protein